MSAAPGAIAGARPQVPAVRPGFVELGRKLPPRGHDVPRSALAPRRERLPLLDAAVRGRGGRPEDAEGTPTGPERRPAGVRPRDHAETEHRPEAIQRVSR